MKTPVGSRVGAISHSDHDTVYMFGFGVYEGDFVPSDEAGGFNLGIPNPRIRLDSGKVVYGCECWWMPEYQVKQLIVTRNVVLADIDQVRRRSRS